MAEHESQWICGCRIKTEVTENVDESPCRNARALYIVRLAAHISKICDRCYAT